MVVKRKVIEDFIRRAYDTACSHGFHDVEKSEEHWMMLVISEIGEMVEADRRKRFADKMEFMRQEEIRIGSPEEYAGFWNRTFEQYIKDTLEDELADVCIRLFDFCGEFGLVPLMFKDGVLEMHDEFKRIFADKTTCEKCFALSALVMDVLRKSGDDDGEKEYYLGMILSFCFEFAHLYGFDLCWHIEQKMKYNESRPKKHGKKY